MKILWCFTVVVCILYQANGQIKNKGSDEKIKELNELSARKSVISLTMNRFKEYVKSTPKDYSFIVMFTAMQPQRKCAICQEVFHEFMLVANSYRYSNSHNGKLFFGVVDFDEGADVFQMLRLNTAPAIIHFPAKGKSKPADTIDFERTGLHAEAIAKWIQGRTDIPIRVFRPPNYSGLVAIILLTGSVGSLLYVKRNNLEFLYNKQMWGIIALFFCFSMISGQMWNQIRGPPLLGRGSNGPQYINGGSHGQYIFESYLVALLNAAVVVGMILMIESSGGVRNIPIEAKVETKPKRFHIVVGLVLVCVFFSCLLSVFRSKTHGYPYSFLFK